MLLCGLLDLEIEPHTQLIVLRSLRYILEENSDITPGAFLLENLLKILKDKEVCSPMRCEALKLVTIAFPIPYDLLRMQEFYDLLPVVANVAKSPDTTYHERVLATQALVGISKKLKDRQPIAAAEVYLLPVLSDVASSIGGEVILQMRQMSKYCAASDIELKFKRLLQLLFLLINSRPEVCLLLLGNVGDILETLADIRHETMNGTEIDYLVHRVIRVEEDDRFSLASKIIHYAFKHLFGFVQRLYGTKEARRELLYKLRNLVAFVCQCNIFDCSTHVKFALLLHSCGDINCPLPDGGTEGEGRFLDRISLHNLLEDGTLNRECTGNMLAENDVWESYLVGKHAACKGAWVVCDSVFRNLAKRVQSELSSCWLSSLWQFAHSEYRLQEMFTRESGPVLVDTSGVLSQLDDFKCDILTSKGLEMLTHATYDILSSERLLGQTTLFKQKFCFQRWFLALRTKVLQELIFDLHKLLGSVLLNQESTQTEGVNDTDCSRLTQEEGVMLLLAGISRKAQKIAREYDLMRFSFINMDPKSFRVISSLALSCSLLAFCTGLAFFTRDKSCTSADSGDCLRATVVEDLLGRLSYVDPGICISIILFFKGDDAHDASLRPTLAAVRSIISMRRHDECSLRPVLNVITRFLLDFAKEWMSIPFHTPKYFFQVRPCIGAVLYTHRHSWYNESTTDVSVVSGSHLSLNLCLQLKNVPREQLTRITKVFCILHCRKSTTRPNTKPSEADPVDYISWTNDSMLLLQERLQWHVIEEAGERPTSNDAGLEAETFVRFEMNGGVQGFASCLLDVSAFPVGSYKIDWLSCCTDDKRSYWSFLPRSPGPVFTVRSS